MIFNLNDQETELRDILSSTGIALSPGVTTKVKLQRNRINYNMRLRDIFNKSAPKIVIRDRDHIFIEDSRSLISSTESVVGQNGFVVLEGIGKLKVAGQTISEIQNTIRKRIELLPDSENEFQIEISDFASQKALISLPKAPGGVIQITDKSVSLDELLTERGLSVDGDTIKRITLHRGSKTYVFTFDKLIRDLSNRVFVQTNDRIVVENLLYKKDKVFILGGVAPKIVEIDPANRQTLADILFASSDVLSSSGAKRSEVYLLRGNDPVVAYHLDAQSPTRLIVADAMELRPNDILYVAEQPIVSFNRTLATIVPLRILLRDIQDDNIP